MWKSNGMSEESIENITKSDSNFAPTFVDHHSLPDMNAIPKKVINSYISYTPGPQLQNLNRFYIRKLLIWICNAN